MGFHVKRTRTAEQPLSGRKGPIKQGDVRYSKTFPTAKAAQREADAWSGAGEFERHGPTGWTAEVAEGRAPREIDIEAGS